MDEVDKDQIRNIGFSTRGQLILSISTGIAFIYLIPIFGWFPLTYHMVKLFKKVDEDNYSSASKKAIMSALIVEIFTIFRLFVYFEIKFDTVFFSNDD